jgi:4-amino-4-deoxy-L-arabinose transferase-like glycosyltransferase
MLAKGPLGLLLPGLVLTLWHGSRREWRRLIELAPLSIVALAVYLPWFVACAKAIGADSILYELYAQNIARFFSGFRGHEQPIYYYLTNFWADLWPWSWLVPFAIWWVFRSELRRDRNVQLALWWFAAFLVFLSFAVTKRQLYLMPAYPAIALLLGPWLAAAMGGESPVVERPDSRPLRPWCAGIAITLLVLGLAFFSIVAAFEPIVSRADLHPAELEVAHALRAPLAGTGVVLLAAALWIGQAWWRREADTATVRVAAAHVVLYMVLLSWVMPTFAPTKTYRPQSQWIRRQIGDQSNFGMVFSKDGLGIRKRGAFAYYSDAMVDLLESQDEVNRYFEAHPDTIVLVHDEQAADIFAGDEETWESRVIRRMRTGRWVFLVVEGPS